MSVRAVQDALSSGLSALTSGMLEGQAAVEAEDYPLASGEMVQRIHLPISGIANRSITYGEFDVTWPYPIINQLASSQHESTQEQPHFASGTELLTDDIIICDAQVRSWQQDESDFYTGATVRVTVWAPEAVKTIKYAAVIHLTFFGYAAAAEDDTETATPEDIS